MRFTEADRSAPLGAAKREWRYAEEVVRRTREERGWVQVRRPMQRRPSIQAVVARSAVEHGNDLEMGCRAFSPPAPTAYHRSP